MSVAVIKGRLNAVENFSKFFQETAETVEKEMHDAPAQFEAEVKANTPNEPMERELFAKTFSIGGSKFEFVQFRFKRGNKISRWMTVGYMLYDEKNYRQQIQRVQQLFDAL